MRVVLEMLYFLLALGVIGICLFVKNSSHSTCDCKVHSIYLLKMVTKESFDTSMHA